MDMRTKRPSSVLLYIATVLTDGAGGANILLLALLAPHITQRESVIGMLGALMIFARIPSNLIGGPVSDRIGRRPFMLTAAGMLLVALWVLGTAESVWALAVSAILSGGSAGLIWFNIEAALGDHGRGTDLHHRVGNFNIFFSVGLIAGTWPIAQIASRSEMGALVSTMAVVLAMTLCLSLAPLSPIRHVREQREEIQPGVRNGYFGALLGANLIIWIGVGVLRFLLPKRVVDLSYAPGVIGNLYLVWYGVMLVGFVWMKLDPRWHHRRWPMMASLALGALGMALLGVTDRMVFLAAGLALFGLAIALGYYTTLFAALDSPTGRGQRSSWHETAIAVGMMIGSQIGGILAESVGPRAPYCGMVLICLLGIGTVWRLAGSTPFPQTRS